MLTKVCKKCGKFIPYPFVYCDDCQKVVDAQRAKRKEEAKRKAQKNYNKKRNPKYTRFYNSIQWRTLSMKYTQDKGYRCEECGAIASEVHHIVPIQTDEGWERRLDYNNLECLCVRCHNKKHYRFVKKKHKKGMKL